MPLIQHPSFPKVVQDVPADKAKEWTDAGWVRVKKEDEDKARAQADPSPV